MKWALVFFVELIDVTTGVGLVDEKSHCITVACLKVAITRTIKITGETPEVRSDKRKRKEE